MPEITNSLRKLVKSLGDAKHRRREHLFIAEGAKCVSDTAGAFICRYLFARREWLDENKDSVVLLKPSEIFQATAADMERMTQLSTAPAVIGVYEIPSQPEIEKMAGLYDELVVGLDRIQDPGNLGTIIRLCDWMGVTTILASNDTTDVWAPKVIQATMGAISRVKVIYCELPSVLKSWKSPVYGTYLHATRI